MIEQVKKAKYQSEILGYYLLIHLGSKLSMFNTLTERAFPSSFLEQIGYWSLEELENVDQSTMGV